LAFAAKCIPRRFLSSAGLSPAFVFGEWRLRLFLS
jgi:hypothetical protein